LRLPLFQFRFNHRQVDIKSRTATCGTIDTERPAIVHDRTVHDRQSQAAALPAPPGSKVGVENAVPNGGINPGAGILYHQSHVSTRTQIAVIQRFGCLDERILKADLQNSRPLCHGLDGIGAKIQNQLLHFPGISQERRSTVKLLSDFDALRKRSPKKSQRVPHHARQIDRQPVLANGTADGYDLLDQSFRPKNAIQGLPEMFLRPGAIRKLQHRHLGVTHDDSKDVVEIVSNASRQGPDRLHFMGLMKASLQSSLPAHIPDRALVLNQVTRLVSAPNRGNQGFDHGAVLPAHGHGIVFDEAGMGNLPEQFLSLLRVLVEVLDLAAHQLGAVGESEELYGCVIEVEPVTFRRRDEDTISRGPKEIPVPLFALAQALFGAVALGHVLEQG